MTDLPPLDPELAELLDAERKRAAPPDAQGAVSSGIAAALGAKPALPAPRLWTPRQVAQVALVSFAAGGLGGALGYARLAPAPPPAPAPVAVAPPPAPPPPLPSAPPEIVPPTPSAPASSAKPAPRTSARAADDDLAAEQVLVETGRAALGRGDYASALAALDKHARQFPRGRLAEERDVLRVQALALAGRTDEARALVQTFRARYPKSVFLPVLDDALRAP